MSLFAKYHTLVRAVQSAQRVRHTASPREYEAADQEYKRAQQECYALLRKVFSLRTSEAMRIARYAGSVYAKHCRNPWPWSTVPPVSWAHNFLDSFEVHRENPLHREFVRGFVRTCEQQA